MPNFVEYLRATRALRIVAIILGVLLLLGLGLRLYFWKGTTPEAVVSELEHSPTAHVTRTQLPGGGTRTVIDDPKLHRHAVVVTSGPSFTLSLAEPRSSPERQTNGVIMGNRSETRAVRGDTRYTELSYRPGTDMLWGALFLVTVPIGLLVATILAGPLAKENDGHLELAWTKPVSRDLYSLAAIAIDGAAIVAAQVLTLVVILAATVVWAIPAIVFEPEAPARIALALIGPFAWYACLTACSASLRRGPGAVIGVGWVVAIITPWVAEVTHAADPLIRGLHALAAAVMYVDPIAYVWFAKSDVFAKLAGFGPNAVGAVAALAVIYVALAVLQWRRVEA
ncbi:MAG TPA: hypothetical protein VHS78_03570 [Candidatus Elarobacter sp.]|nr:hypothetical protein [Candidatus Elarobacter sp.]